MSELINDPQVRRQSQAEVKQIKAAVLEALPEGVDKANIIIALAEVQSDMAELIIDGGYDDGPGFDKISHLFTEADGTHMHTETKRAFEAVVLYRLTRGEEAAAPQSKENNN